MTDLVARFTVTCFWVAFYATLAAIVLWAVRQVIVALTPPQPRLVASAREQARKRWSRR